MHVHLFFHIYLMISAVGTFTVTKVLLKPYKLLYPPCVSQFLHRITASNRYHILGMLPFDAPSMSHLPFISAAFFHAQVLTRTSWIVAVADKTGQHVLCVYMHTKRQRRQNFKDIR